MDFTTAVDVYRKTVKLSGFDMNGMPQLTKLEFVLDHMDGEVRNEAAFLNYLDALHGAYCQSAKSG